MNHQVTEITGEENVSALAKEQTLNGCNKGNDDDK